MTLGPQFYPKGVNVERSQNIPKDAPLYHGTGGAIEGGIVRPSDGAFGEGSYATEGKGTAGTYAAAAARDQGRLFGTVYEVSPISERATHVGSQAGSGVVLDPEGLSADKAVDFPPAIQQQQYSRAERRAKEIRSHGWSHIDMPTSFHG